MIMHIRLERILTPLSRKTKSFSSLKAITLHLPRLSGEAMQPWPSAAPARRGHFVMLDDPPRFIQAVRDFIGV